MCGLIATVVRDTSDLKEQFRALYQSQKIRGSEGFGIGVRKADGRLLRYRSTTEKAIFDAPVWVQIEVGDAVIFHHRAPTSTPNILECNHPFLSCSRDFLLAHNGIIYGLVLKGRHEFESEIRVIYRKKRKTLKITRQITDSELAVHYLEEKGFPSNFSALKVLAEETNDNFLILTSRYNGVIFISRDLKVETLLGNTFIVSGSYYHHLSSIRILDGVIGILTVKGLEVIDRFNTKPKIIYLGRDHENKVTGSDWLY